GATDVSFGSTSASFTVDNDGQITATAPPHAAGPVHVRVTTVGGTSATSVSDEFLYLDAPTVTSVSPTAGPTAGGTTVTITGTGLTGATSVKFGSTDAASFTNDVNTPDQVITAVSPAELAGTVHITVTTPFGTSATSASDEFTFVGTAAHVSVTLSP